MEQPLILDRYRPLAELGSGGHGEVVLAFDTRMARRVAVKRLPVPTDRRGRPLQEAGLAESRTAAMLNHPNIVTVHDWDTDSDEAFIVMEHVDGVSLADILDSFGPLDLNEAAVVAGAVSEALGYAHANGVLHLDVKPENVMVTRDGAVKVADFGVSALSTLDGHGPASAGTIGFMPLEQLTGETVDERTDEWALAALTMEMLTDANPFASDTHEGSIFAQETIPVPPPSEFEPSLDPELDEVLLAALAADPDERWDSVAEFARHLLPLLGDTADGRVSLASVVGELTAEDAEGTSVITLGLWDRLRPWEGLARRAFAGAVSGWVTHVCLAPVVPSTRALWGAAALVAVSAALVPAAGSALALIAVTAAALTQIGPLPGVAVGLLAAVYWWFLARRGGADSFLPLAAPALGAFGAAPFAAVLLGFLGRPRRAAVLGALSALAAAAASGASGEPPPHLDVAWSVLADPFAATALDGARAALSGPGPYLAAAAWGATAFIASLLCGRASRIGAWAGVATGAAIVYVGYFAWSLADAALTLPSDPVMRHIGVTLILGVLLAAAGPPLRPEEDG